MKGYVLLLGTILYVSTWSNPALGTKILTGTSGSSGQKSSLNPKQPSRPNSPVLTNPTGLVRPGVTQKQWAPSAPKSKTPPVGVANPVQKSPPIIKPGLVDRMKNVFGQSNPKSGSNLGPSQTTNGNTRVRQPPAVSLPGMGTSSVGVAKPVQQSPTKTKPGLFGLIKKPFGQSNPKSGSNLLGQSQTTNGIGNIQVQQPPAVSLPGKGTQSVLANPAQIKPRLGERNKTPLLRPRSNSLPGSTRTQGHVPSAGSGLMQNGATRTFPTQQEHEQLKDSIRPAYLSTLGAYGASKNDKIQKLSTDYQNRAPEHAKLGVNQYLGLKTYTGGLYGPRINDHLRNGGQDENLGIITQDMNQALQRLKSPAVQKTYRGTTSDFIGLDPRTGEMPRTLTDKAFTSSSLDRTVAEGFATQTAQRYGSLPALITVHSNSGVNIQSLSKKPEEKEVLFPSGTDFHVSKSNINGQVSAWAWESNPPNRRHSISG